MVLLLGGCADTEQTPSLVDHDDDGYSQEIDCDDWDPAVNPAAVERENCLDDNCDGRLDDGTANFDEDGDGYCPSTGDVGECEGDAKRHPGAAEDGGDGTGKPNGIDDDCNGHVDDGLAFTDLDGDGFSIVDGDCNDLDASINPGAIEVEGLHCKRDEDCPTAGSTCLGGYCRCTAHEHCYSEAACTVDADCSFAGEQCDGGKCRSTYRCLAAQPEMADPQVMVCRDKVDNDCDGKTDEMPRTCDEIAALGQDDPYDYARAMELCDVDRICGLDAPCPGKLLCVKNKCRRVISASFNTDADAKARAIATRFALNGPYKPKAGQSFAVLSTGLASYTPAQVCPQNGTIFTNEHLDPDPYAKDTQAFDYIELALEILVPTNARSFDFDFNFFSAEYPEYVGTQFNDTFWVHLQSIEFNGNISFDKKDTPIRINNAFFSICDVYPPKPQTQQMCSKPAAVLTGTGYAEECNRDDPEYGTISNGGSTDWLHTTAPVTPGETIRLTFSIFDKGDHILDSAVLIDNFRWKLAPASTPYTAPD